MPTYYLANFCQKLHENEEILGQRGGGHLDTPLDRLELQVAHVSPGKFRGGNEICHWIHYPHASEVNKMLVEILFLILEVIKY